MPRTNTLAYLSSTARKEKFNVISTCPQFLVRRHLSISEETTRVKKSLFSPSHLLYFQNLFSPQTFKFFFFQGWPREPRLIYFLSFLQSFLFRKKLDKFYRRGIGQVDWNFPEKKRKCFQKNFFFVRYGAFNRMTLIMQDILALR